MTNIAVLGHGVVGSGVCEVLEKNAESIADKAGDSIQVKRVLDLREFPELPYADKFTKNFDDILTDDSIQIVVEVMGGVNPAYDFAKACLQSRRSVVTSNKELVAAKGAELLSLAQENGVNFLFEASVGGGIPIIRPLHQCLAANQIEEIAGILNGTTNFILTKMIKDGMEFSDALLLAQQLGYAEANPSADVEGHDACRKICILASLAFGSHVYPESVPTVGIASITAEDVQFAESAGCVIKLIGQARRIEGGKVYAMVSPALIGHDSQLAGVDDVFNGILVRGNATGDVVFYGKGAGKLPTASAVVGDVIECVKAQGTNKSLHWNDSDKNNVVDYLTLPVQLYVRCTVSGKDVISKIFGEVQYLTRKNRPENEFAFLTSTLPEGDLNAKLKALRHEGGTVLASIRKLDY